MAEIAQRPSVVFHAVQSNDIQDGFEFQIVIIPHCSDGQAAVIDVFNANNED